MRDDSSRPEIPNQSFANFASVRAAYIRLLKDPLVFYYMKDKSQSEAVGLLEAERIHWAPSVLRFFPFGFY